MVLYCGQRKKGDSYLLSLGHLILFSRISKASLRERYYYPHFSHKETGLEVNILLKVTEQASGIFEHKPKLQLQSFGSFHFISN